MRFHRHDARYDRTERLDQENQGCEWGKSGRTIKFVKKDYLRALKRGFFSVCLLNHVLKTRKV